MNYKVGDRVAVYGDVALLDNNELHLFTEGCKGTVVNVEYSTCIQVEFDNRPGLYASNGKTVIVHPKQCRKLKKKLPAPPVYVSVDKLRGLILSSIVLTETPNGTKILFTEVNGKQHYMLFHTLGVK